MVKVTVLGHLVNIFDVSMEKVNNICSYVMKTELKSQKPEVIGQSIYFDLSNAHFTVAGNGHEII